MTGDAAGTDFEAAEDAGTEDGDGPRERAPVPVAIWRLRDLERRGQIIAALLGLLLLVPVGTSVVRAWSSGWVPSGDDALIVLRAYDVFSGDAPLVGQPSTAEFYAEGVAARHPGPIEFYALAVPVRLLGPAMGTLLTAAAIAGASVLVSAWVAFRGGGPAVGLGAAVLLALVMWSSGTAVLSDPISSNVGGYPLMAGTALAWALWCDDRRLWPLAALVWSFTIQQHLAVFGVAGVVSVWGVVGAAVITVRRRREAGRLASSARWGAAGLAVAVLCWIPPLLDQLTGTGNLAKIVRFSRSGDRPGLGLRLGLNAGARAIAAPPALLRRQLTDQEKGGWFLFGDLDGTDRIGLAVALVAALATAAITLRSRWPSTEGQGRLALLGTAAVLVVGGVITTAQVPASVEAGRINFYRWVQPASVAGWGAVAWTVGSLVIARRPVARVRGTPATVAGAAAAGIVVAAIVTATSAHSGSGDRRRDSVLFDFNARAAEAALAEIPRDRPVRIATPGIAAFLSVGPAVAVAFTDAGLEVRVDEFQEPGYGTHRARAAQGPETTVCVISKVGPVPDGPGTSVATEALPLEPGGRSEVWGDDSFEVRVLAPGETTCSASPPGP